MNYFLKQINNYYQDFQPGDWLHWSYPLFSVAMIWILAIILLKFVFGTKTTTFNRIFYVYKSSLIAANIVLGCIVINITYWWARSYYSQNTLQFSHLLSLLFVITTGIFFLIKLRNHFTHHRIIDILKQPLSDIEQTTLVNKARKEYFRHRWWLLLPLACFVTTFAFLQLRSTVLLSIIIDDSGSMSSTDALKYGQEAMSRTFSSFDDRYTKVVISSFIESTREPSSTQPFGSSEHLMKLKNPIQTPANTIVAGTLSEATVYVNSLAGGKGLGLNQAIWNNYLTSKEMVATNTQTYTDRVMLIISDGLEFNRAWYGNNTLCSHSEYTEFYQGNVYWIDLLNRSGTDPNEIANFDGFNSMMQECYPAQIYPGFTMEDYTAALQDVLNQFELNPFIIWVSLAIVLFYSIIFILIVPSSINQR